MAGPTATRGLEGPRRAGPFLPEAMRPVTPPDEVENPGDAGLGRSAGSKVGESIAALSPAENGSSLGTTWVGRVTDLPTSTRSWAVVLRAESPGAGRRVGPYRLVEPLGSGGQAVVWRAIEDASPHREVALKLLVAPPPRGRHPEAPHAEARHGARLDHPSILAVTDSGIADGVSYLAMPLVEGGTLADALDQRRRRAACPPSSPDPAGGDDLWLAALSASEYPRAAAGVVARVARALHSAHQSRVIHCDVKPSNILMDRHRPEQIYLADFGLALDLEAATPEQLRALKGTPVYMAPEKLRGRPWDGRLCDVYALGVTLFEAVTGVKPFHLSEDSYSPVVMMAQVLAQEPLRPRAVAPWLAPGLEAIILTAMAPDPARRYPSATDVAEDLEDFLAGREVGPRARRAG
jgi:eukaryotic-like serine/threonine-protein kinase